MKAFPPPQTVNNRADIRPRRLTVHAGFVERGRGVKGGVHLGAVGQQHFHTLYATRGAGVAERGTAIDIPGIHLYNRRKKVRYLQAAVWQYPLPMFSLLLTLEISWARERVGCYCQQPGLRCSHRSQGTDVH